MVKSEYSFYLKGKVLVITDMNSGKMSVTNDIENVVEDIAKQMNISLQSMLKNYKIIQVDSENEYSLVYFIGLNPKWDMLSAKNINDAIDEILI